MVKHNDNGYDVVIIGAGMSCLLCCCYLAAGMKVFVWTTLGMGISGVAYLGFNTAQLMIKKVNRKNKHHRESVTH